MILGLSLIVAFLSYLIYRRLLLSWKEVTGTGIFSTSTSTSNSGSGSGYGSDSGSSTPTKSTPQPVPMWPFLSTLLQQPSSSTTVKSTAFKYSPKLSHPIATPSPDSTPKASPVAPTIQVDDIPHISLSAPTIEIDVVNIDHANNDNSDGDDYVPSFPSLNSAQRASGGINSLRPSNSTLLSSSSSSSSKSTPLSMPPPLITIRGRNPKGNIRFATIPQPAASPPSAASVLRQNPNGVTRSKLVVAGAGASGVAAGNGLTLPKSRNSTPSEVSKSRKKVTLEPGHSPLDWARLQRSGIDLRGLPNPNLIKVPPSLLAKHSKAPENIWTALNGRVYNITSYLPFHPGGEKDLLRGAGKDSTKLFNATHPWVNIEGMLSECLIGIFVSEEEVVSANGDSESGLDSID